MEERHAFSDAEDSAADYLPLYEMRRETSWELLAGCRESSEVGSQGIQ